MCIAGRPTQHNCVHSTEFWRNFKALNAKVALRFEMSILDIEQFRYLFKPFREVEYFFIADYPRGEPSSDDSVPTKAYQYSFISCN